MTTLPQRIQILSDAHAQHVLTTFAKNQAGYHDAVLSPELVEALGYYQEPASTDISEGDLARATLLLLADDPQYRPIIDAMVSNPSTQQFGLVETTAIMGAVLFVLGIHVTVERDKVGKWQFKIEKKPTDTSLLTSLMQKLSGFAKQEN
jgi:hypothetical protein